MRNEVTLQIEVEGKNYPLIIRPTEEIDPHDGEIVEIECQGAGIWPQDYLREDLPWLIDDIREMIIDHQERIKKKLSTEEEHLTLKPDFLFWW